MKKTLLFSAIALLAFASCKKNNGPGNTPPTVDSLKIGLIAYYPFNNSAADLSGNNNNGTAYNVTSVTNRKGIANSAYYFKGDTNSYIVVKDNASLRLTDIDYTINLWVKIDTFSANYGDLILTKRFAAQTTGMTLSLSNPLDTHPVGSVFFGPGGGYPSLYSNGVLSTGGWNMITIEYDYAHEQVTMYINGVYDNISQQNIVSPNSTADLYFGRDNPAVNSSSGYNLLGSLDDIRIYNRALSTGDITKLFNLDN